MTKPNGWKLVLAACFFCVAAVSAAPAQTFTTLFRFDLADGYEPSGSPTQGVDGEFYSVTTLGGLYAKGTVFKITSGGTLTTLYNFCAQSGCLDGDAPNGALILAANGDFYGTTSGGGTNSCSYPYGCGTIFKITRGGVLTTIHSFSGSDGAGPLGPLVQAPDGTLYGIASGGGMNSDEECQNGCGTVFKISPGGGDLTTLYNFCSQPECADGHSPYGGLVQATDGNFYGVTPSGGTRQDGTIFKITPAGTFTNLYTFCIKHFFCSDGSGPVALLQATDGNFYGVTGGGGVKTTICAGGCGTVFQMTPAGTLTTLFNFNYTDGGEPTGLIQATDGNFYGNTALGGTTNFYGTIFEFTPNGTLTTLHTFCVQKGCPDGRQLFYAPIQGTDGILYGTTNLGSNNHFCGIGGCGTVYSLNVGLVPFVGFVRDTAKVGQSAGILGGGLTGTTGVSFNGVPARFSVRADTFLSAIVPSGATTGYVTVTTPSGTLTSNLPFHVLP